MLHIRTSGQQKRNMQHQLMANGQWLIATSSLSHPDFNRRYRNCADSGIVIKTILRRLSLPVRNYTSPQRIFILYYYNGARKICQANA